MAQKLKLQELMELFNEKLDKAIEKFDLNEKIISTVDGKLEELKKTSVKVEFEPLNEVIKEITQIFVKHREESKIIYEKQRNESTAISEKHNSKIKDVVKKEEKYQLYFYSALSVVFLLSAAFLMFGINQHYGKKDVEKELKFFTREARQRHSYLKEKNLIGKYEKWLESKQKEPHQN